MATEAPTIVPPSAPARPVAAGAPSAVPASAGEIHVTPGKLTPVPSEAPKTGSAKSRLRESLEAKSNANPRTAAPPVAKPVERPGTAATPPVQPKPGEATASPAEPAATAATETPKPGESTAVDPKDGKRPSPWKLVEDYKAKATKAEQELAQLRQNQLPENDRKSLEERIAKAEQQAAEYKKRLIDKDWQESDDYKKQQSEYESAWKVAIAEMQGITVSDGQGGERPVSAQDLLTIVNAPMAQARKMSEELFGSYANDVMLHRNKIRDLFDNQSKSLEAKKAESLAKKQQELETQAKTQKELMQTISTTWQKENEAALNDPKYGPLFKPREGDEQWNQRLAKGFELVDKAFSQNPADPKLTPEERAAVIRRHAAVRNRAAAWGPLRGEVEALTAQVKSLTEELATYKGTEPPTGGERKTAPAAAPGSGNAKAGIMEELKKRAR